MSAVPVEIVQSAYNWWDLVPAAVGALIGAAAAAIPAFLLAKKASSEVLTRDQEIRDRDDETTGYRVYTLLEHLANQVISFRSHVEEMISAVPIGEDEEFPLQRRILPMVGTSAADVVSTDRTDLQVFIKHKEAKFVSELFGFIRRYNSLLHSIMAYSELRSEIQRAGMEAEDYTVEHGNSVALRLDKKGYVRLSLMQRNAETLAVQLVQSLREDSQEAVRLAHTFNGISNRIFGIRDFPRLEWDRAVAEFPDLAIAGSVDRGNVSG